MWFTDLLNNKDHVSGYGGLDEKICGLVVPDLAYHHHVRVAAQNLPEGRGEGEPCRGIYLDLGYAFHPVLDGIVHSDDVALLVVGFS